MIARVSCLIGVVAIASLAAGAPPGRTQQAPAGGRACVCPQNGDAKQAVRGCTGSSRGQDADVAASCGPSGSGVGVAAAPPRIAAPPDDGRCAPCGERTQIPSSAVINGLLPEGLHHQTPSSLATRGIRPLPQAAAPAPASGGSLALQPVRAFMRARDIPPQGVGAYGVVAMRSLPTPASRDRLTRFCTALLAHLPPQGASEFPQSQQMVTVWPLDQPDAEPAKSGDCGFALDHYDLQGGLSAIADAGRQHARLDGQGPFLLGWSPSVTRGVPDKVVLVVDMSTFETQESFDEACQYWQQKVIEDPELWRSGFAMERLRLSIADFVDHYGSAILGAVKLFGGGS